MPKRINIGTDIAMIGVWDPDFERHDLQDASYADFQSGLESEARGARLFFIYTGGDGGHLTDIYSHDTPDEDILSLYSPAERRFLVQSHSGHLVAGGMEDFVSSTKTISPEKNQFNVEPGFYALSIHELVEERLIDRLRDHVGASDYAYYELKTSRFSWGCFLFFISLIASILLITKWWVLSVGAFAIWGAYTIFRSVADNADERFREISSRIEELGEQFPDFIYVLSRTSGNGDVEGGWHNLT